MIEDRVGEVRLRIRTDLSERAEIRPAAEEMVCRALERCAAIARGARARPGGADPAPPAASARGRIDA